MTDKNTFDLEDDEFAESVTETHSTSYRQAKNQGRQEALAEQKTYATDKMARITTRVTQEIDQKWELYATFHGKSKQQVLHEAMTQFLADKKIPGY